MTAELVTYAVDSRVGIVTLNRPDKLNAISAELKRLLVERFHEADGDPAARPCRICAVLSPSVMVTRHGWVLHHDGARCARVRICSITW